MAAACVSGDPRLVSRIYQLQPRRAFPGSCAGQKRARRRGRLGYQERSRLLDLMEERLPREEWRAMGFGDGRERRPLWSKWLVNEKVDESFNEESRQNEGRQDQTKGPGQQRCHAPCQLLLQPLARHARISFARFYTVEPHHAAETDRRP